MRATFRVEFYREVDGRWIADVTPRQDGLPSTVVYGATREEAYRKAVAIILRELASRSERGELPATAIDVSFVRPKAA